MTGPDGGLTLSLDTSTVVNVGLARGSVVLATAGVDDRMAHVEQLTPLIKQCMDSVGVTMADLNRVVVGLGPGPFTGLRVGIVTAQVLASALHLDFRGVCSLDVLAAQFGPGHRSEFVVATDARRREVYWARYDADGRRVGGPYVGAPDTLPALPTIGPATDLLPDLETAVAGPRRLDAGVLAAQGWTLPDAGREPLYLRRPDAAEPTRRKSVLHHSSRVPGPR